MGQILSAKEIVKNNIETFLENNTKDYSLFLNSAPTFVTFYSKNVFQTTFDKAFEAVNEIVGAESPVKFNTVKDLPVYAVQSSGFGTEITDFGIAAEIESSAIILPNTIKPEVDDFFSLFYNGTKKLFQISNVEVDNYRNTTYYKISFFLSSSNIADIELQSTKTLHIDYEKIGKVKNPYSEENKYNIYQDLKKIYDGLLENFLHNYYDKDAHCLVNPHESTVYSTSIFVIDSNVNNFVLENKLLDYWNRFREFHYIHRDIINNIDRPLYRKTIFYNITEAVNTLDTKVTNRKIVLNPERGILYSNSWRLRKPYVSIKNKETTYTPNSSEELMTYIDATLYTKITTNNLVGVTNEYEKIIIKYFNNYYNSTDKYLEFIDDFNVLEDYPNNFYIIPLVLFIGKFYINQISTNP